MDWSGASKMDFTNKIFGFLAGALAIVVGITLLPTIVNMLTGTISPTLASFTGVAAALNSSGYPSLAALFASAGVVGTIFIFALLGVIIYYVIAMLKVPKK